MKIKRLYNEPEPTYSDVKINRMGSVLINRVASSHVESDLLSWWVESEHTDRVESNQSPSESSGFLLIFK